MQQVWKYELSVEDSAEVIMPQNSQVLCVQMQNDKPCIWVLVNPNSPKEKRTFEIYGTGHPIQIGARKYIGTFQVHGGVLVFHLFELNPSQN